MKKILKYTGLSIWTIAVILAAAAFFNMRDRHRGYDVDIDIVAPASGSVYAGLHT